MADNYALIKRYARSEEIKQIFRSIVGDERAESYIYSVIVAVSASEQLQRCTPESIMRSAARAATMGLSCDPALGQAHLVPYKDEATLIPGWRGYRDMAYRTGQVAVLNIGALYEGQEWIENQLTGESMIEGLPTSNEIKGYFAYMRTTSRREHTLYMSREEINKHKEKYAPGWKRQGSAWQDDFDKMARKTVVKQLITLWATLDPTGRMIANLEAMDAIDEMPPADTVTVIEPERKSNPQILSELGFDDDTSTTFIEQPVYADPNDEPETTDTVDVDTPTSSKEMYARIMRGELPYIGVSDAKTTYEQCKSQVDITWESLKALSQERADAKAGKKKNNEDQPELL